MNVSLCKYFYSRFEVFTAMRIQVEVFWVVTCDVEFLFKLLYLTSSKQ